MRFKYGEYAVDRFLDEYRQGRAFSDWKEAKALLVSVNANYARFGRAAMAQWLLIAQYEFANEDGYTTSPVYALAHLRTPIGTYDVRDKAMAAVARQFYHRANNIWLLARASAAQADATPEEKRFATEMEILVRSLKAALSAGGFDV
jgi:hypothetical protein